MEGISGRVEAKSSFNYFFYNRDSLRPHSLTFVSKEYIDGEMDIKIYLLMEGEIYQCTELDIVGKIILALALKKNQFDFIKKWTEPNHVWNNLIGEDIRSRGQLKWKHPFITFC